MEYEGETPTRLWEASGLYLTEHHESGVLFLSIAYATISCYTIYVRGGRMLLTEITKSKQRQKYDNNKRTFGKVYIPRKKSD